MKPVVVTGGFGYVGGRIVQKLMREGMRVRIPTRRERTGIPDWATNITWGSDLGALCRGAGSLIHLAAPNENICAANPMQAIADTLALTEAALVSARGTGLRRIIYFSTVHVYGPLQGHIDEETPSRPAHPYAEAHLKSEQLLKAAADENLEVLTLRLSNGFGAPADHGTDRWTLLVNDLCRQAIHAKKLVLKSDGRQRRDFLPLTDIAGATAYFTSRDALPKPYTVLNLSAGDAMSVLDMAKLIQTRASALLGEDIPLRVPPAQGHDESPDLIIDNRRLIDAGYTPKADLNAEIDGLLQFCLTETPPNDV